MKGNEQKNTQMVLYKRMNFLITILLFCSSLSIYAQSDTTYIIKRGDVLEINVMEHPEFTVSGLMVMPDGNVQFPGLGSIPAVGISIKDFTTLMQHKLEKYVVNPILTVFVKMMPNQVINVIGFVNRPGQITIFESTDLITALSKAGGIKNIRQCRWITIIRADQTFEKYSAKDIFNKNFNKDKIPKLNIGDTVYVLEPAEFNWSKLSFFVTLSYVVLMIISYIRK